MVTKALVDISNKGGIKPTPNNTGGVFYIYFLGDSHADSYYEKFDFTYPLFMRIIKNNIFFKTANGNLNLLYCDKIQKIDDIDCYAYISLREVKSYMTKNGYFSDLLKTLPTVWSFKYDNTILIDNPKKGDTFKSGDILTVKAYIDKIATYAILSIGNRREFKNLLENENEDKGVVTFSDYTFTDSDIGNLDVKVEVGRFMYLPSAIHVVQVLVEGSGKPAITNDWLNLYSNPTVSGSGRSVEKHPNAFNNDWGCPEELSAGMQDNLLPVNARNTTGKTPIKTNNNLYVDETGRYWVAVGPNVVNPNFSGSNITDKDMQYGTKIDIVVLDESTSTKYYIPAVVGDAKEHSAPDGVYQTGVPFDSKRPIVNPGLDRNTVEFMGYEILDKYGNYDPAGKNSSVTITNNYKLIELIVYDGIYNYK